MIIYKEKCPECGKIIEGISDKEVKAWLEQHLNYKHNTHSKVGAKGGGS